MLGLQMCTTAPGISGSFKQCLKSTWWRFQIRASGTWAQGDARCPPTREQFSGLSVPAYPLQYGRIQTHWLSFVPPMAYREVMCLRLISFSSWGHPTKSRETDIAGVRLPGRPGEGQLYLSCTSVSSARVSEVLWEWLALPRLEWEEGPRNQILNKNTIFLFPMVPGTVLNTFSTARRKW